MTQARRKTNGAAGAAATAIETAATASLTAPEGAGDPILNDTVFPRLSVERRVLGYVTDEVDVIALGPRNTLAAITYGLMNDPNTTRPPGDLPRLDVEGKSTAEVAQEVLDMLNELIEAGLVKQRADDSYTVTKAGAAELAG